MKKVRRIMAVACFFVCMYIMNQIFEYILVDDTSSYTRIMMHELYNQEENIDVLFVGSSHCYRSFVPEVTDELLGKNTFNAGSSMQWIDTSYHLIREAAKNNDLEQVYLELYYVITLDGAFKNRKQMTSTYIVADYMKPSLNKLQLLINASSKEHYSNSFIPARREWEKIFNLDYVVDLLKKKQSAEYKNYGYSYVTGEDEAYVGKGYVVNTQKVEANAFFGKKADEPIDIDKMKEDWKNTLYKIIDFCDKENIKLTLVTAPMSEYMLSGRGNYDEYVEAINALIEGTDVKYYDFNLCREEYFPSNSLYFSDPSHLNKEGAKVFSTIFSEFFAEGNELKADELFYDSYETRLQNLPPEVYGLSYRENEDREDYDVKIISNPYGNLEYRIEVQPADDSSYVVQDYSEHSEFTLMKNETGICKISVRKKENPDKITQILEISYSY